VIWIRATLLAVVSGVVVLALTQTAATPPLQPPPSEMSPTQSLAPTGAPTPTRVPLPTAPPQMIISRLARETPMPRPTAIPSGQPRVSVVDNGYLPSQMIVQAGTGVLWVNGGSDGHDVTGNGPGGIWRSGPLAPAERYERAFSLAGTYDYACSIHPEMRGRLVVQL